MVSIEVDKDDRNFPIKGYDQPEELKQYFSTIKPGMSIMVKDRYAIVDGQSKKCLQSFIQLWRNTREIND